MAAVAPPPRERRPSTSAPIADLKGPVGPNFTRPKHKRTVTGFGPSEIKSVEASIPEPQREAWRKFVSLRIFPAVLRGSFVLQCGVADRCC
jgi:starch phosphorylase